MSSTIQLPQTGQVTSYAAGDDGDLQTGVAWPSPRFVDNGNGTITDKLTGLDWLKKANCFGAQSWTSAIASANGLASGACSLTDNSTAGQWRLPNILELYSLVNMQVPDGAAWLNSVGFENATFYWSSTILNSFPNSNANLISMNLPLKSAHPSTSSGRTVFSSVTVRSSVRGELVEP
jgi:hypothetical protein